MGEAPFWSDDFDMDFPKIFPDARRLLGDLGDVKLMTFGHSDKTGRLNHPAVWNGDNTMLSFFGFGSPRKPTFHASPSSQLVQCTAWEMFRDAWPHHYLIQVEQRPIWVTFALMPQFDAIMFDLRGWRAAPKQATRAKRVVMNSYCEAIRQFGYIVERFPNVRAKATVNL